MNASSNQALSPVQRERIYRRNFFFFLADGMLFMIAMGIIGSTTVVPDFVRNLTDSEILIGLSGSMFSIGFTLPQLFVARYIVRAARKKWWFVGPNIPVRFVILIFAAITVLLGEDRLDLILLAFLICYGIAALGDGLVGVPWADLTGSSLDSRWRARMFGIMSAGTGVIMLGVVPLVANVLGDDGPAFPNNYALLFGAAGVLFAISILPMMFICELPSGKPTEKIPSFSEFVPHLGRLLRTDVPFRALIVIRMLTSLFLMAAPFYIGFATVQLDLSSDVAVPTLLAMQTLGSITGALAYTWLGARNNVLFIQLALACAALQPFAALLAGVVGPLPLYFGFLMFGIAISNLFFSYQNWIVTYAPADLRPIYVGLSNTIAAIFSMMAPIIGGTIAQYAGYQTLFAVALVMALGALMVTIRYIHEPQPESVPGTLVGD